MQRSNRKTGETDDVKMILTMVGAMAVLVGSMQIGAQAPAVATVQTVPAEPSFPPMNPKNFTATTPTKAEVDSFLTALWGYDPNRAWSVAAIQKTTAPGVAKVTVYVADKSQPGNKGSSTVFFTTPDGMHAIAGDVIDFGVKPFAATHKVLQERANGPSHGATGKEFELVEFADLQCPHCKEAADTMEQLAQDFPQARIVFENFPLSEIHLYAFVAAAEGVCVRKAKGDAAFFTYISAVFDTQGALTPDSHDATLSAAAMKAGADPVAMAACAQTAEAKEEVNASLKLGDDLNVDQTPMLAINGHLLPMGGIPYETLRKIVAFQAEQDGITVHLQPSLTGLK